MKKFNRFVVLVSCMCLIVFASRSVQGAEFNLRITSGLPIGSHGSVSTELFAKMIGERTGGRVDVKFYPAGQLFSDKDTMKAVPSGAVDMAQVALYQWTGLVPGFLFLDLPLFFNDWPHVYRTVDGEAGMILRKDLEKVGVKLLYWMTGDSTDFASKQPIRTLEDFKGKRLRALGELTAESIKALGGSATFLGGGEVYMALQRGTVDGAISGATTFWERKYYEVTHYLTYSNYNFAMWAVVMNLKKWNELPPDIQNIILNCSLEAQAWVREAWKKKNEESLKLLSEKMEVFTVPEREKKRWREASLPPTTKIFLKQTGEKDGKLLMDLAEKVR
jgi:tripartite ATP-independent transporter DctP family solute receptor